MVRCNTNGGLDTTFDGDGIVTGNNFVKINSIAVQSDQKIVAGGYSIDPVSNSERFTLARYNTNGSIQLSGFTVLSEWKRSITSLCYRSKCGYFFSNTGRFNICTFEYRSDRFVGKCTRNLYGY